MRQSKAGKNVLQPKSLSTVLADNLERLKRDFTYPDNTALSIRHLYVPALKTEAALLFLEGAADPVVIENMILEPLLNKTPFEPRHEDVVTAALEEILTSTSGKTVSAFEAINHELLFGRSVVLFDGADNGLTIQTPGFKTRPVATPAVEHVLRGPKEAFVESIATNRSLIRRQLRDRHLVTESVNVGMRAKSEVTILYINDLANPELVEKVRKRVASVEADAVSNLSILEQYIEDRSYSLIPSALQTERPDRACSFLLEGHIVLLMDNSPTAMIVPVTFWALFHTPEDTYLRWAYGNFLRILRLLAIFVALMTPSIYIAISTFHEEMLPTDLLLAIAAARERVPFPALIEVFIMELAFELVREASVRVPTIIGPTIGIVGALILGQAAVEANIISPILVIVVAMTGISSFTIPEISFNFGVRIVRFLNLLVASFLGFFGIALLFTCIIAYMVSFKSFGVPFLAPLSPHYRSSKDMILRPPLWKQWLRPLFTVPQVKKRGPKPGGNAR